MKALALFRPRIAPRVEGCIEDLIDQSVLDTCIDFCERSLVVKRMATSFLTVASQLAYTLESTSDTSIAHIARLWCDITELTPADEDMLRTPFGFVAAVPGAVSVIARPRFFNQASPGVIDLYPTPDKAYTINMRVALKPTRSAVQVDDQIFEDWIDYIVHGALERLYMMPGGWANPGLAKYHSDQYEIGVNLAITEARKGSISSQARIIPVRI